MRYITVDGVKYRIRGPWAARKLRELFVSFQAKYPKSTMHDFLMRGMVYNRVKR